MPGFNLVDQISMGGFRHKPNEDRAGMAGAHAWVIDGATGLGDPFMPGASDAAWLAQRAGEALARNAALQDHASLLSAVADDLVDAFEAERTRDLQHRWELPCGAFMLATACADGIALSWVGDCRAIVAVHEGPMLTFGATPASEADEARLVQQLAGGNSDPAARYREPAALAALREGRGAILAAGSALILAPDRGFLRRVRSANVICERADLLLMTDGFAAGELRYELYRTSDELIGQARSEGLALVGARVRTFENVIDPAGQLKPRWKRSDDATATLLHFSR